MIPVIFLFFLIAFIYSSVGLAGGSSYLAVLAGIGMERETLVPVALFCNLIVSLQGTVSYFKAGFFRPKLFWPLVITSVPFAFLGGKMAITDRWFYLLLGFSLGLAAIRMFRCQVLFVESSNGRFKLLQKVPGTWMVVGAGLGFLAGLVGLGGGIFLGPLLILSGTASSKETAGVTAPFIFVNSLAGLLAHAPHVESFFFQQFFILFLAVGLGGLLGSTLGAFRWKPVFVQRVAALLIGLVSLKLLGRIL